MMAEAISAAAHRDAAAIITRATWRSRAKRARPHGLPGDLIVSLTSYPPRFATLHLTLQCLLGQSTRPNGILLWIAQEDFQHLPTRVLELQDDGLAIQACEDLGSYKKIVPTLKTQPDAFIVTADDDVYYDPKWLENLVSQYDAKHPAIICRRAHRVRLDASGDLCRYADWDHALKTPATGRDLLPTGEGGVLYYPGALPAETIQADAFLSLAPNADDLWLFWMAQKTGAQVHTTSDNRPAIHWAGSQRSALYRRNVTEGGLNDSYLQNLTATFGLPSALTEQEHR